MKILVTGAAGFIGSHLVDGLLGFGHDVVGVDNLSNGRIENLKFAVENPSFKFIKGDICNIGAMVELFDMEKFDFVYHEAAEARIPACTDDPLNTTTNNVLATVALLEISRQNGVKGFAFASSSSVYGNKDKPVKEDDSRAPFTIYGSQKLAAEEFVSKYFIYHKLKTVAFRYFNVYGSKRQNEKGAYVNVFAALNKAERDNEDFKIFGDGTAVRDYIHVYDVVSANIRLINRADDWCGWGKMINLGTGVGTTVNDVVSLFGYNRCVHVEVREGDVSYSCADVSFADKCGFEPEITVDEGIQILKNS
jgi:UDP-glucose 4-epimerase